MPSAAPTETWRVVDLRALRDDGWLSAGLGRLVAGALPPLLPTVVGVSVAVVLLGAGFGRLSGAVLFAPAVALLLSGVAAEHPHDGRFDRLVPVALYGTECLYILAVGYGTVPAPLVFALLAVVVLRHCDAAHRARHGVRIGDRAVRAMLGWDGRVLVLAAGGMFGWLPAAYAVLAGYLWVVFTRETVASWYEGPAVAGEDMSRDDG